MAHPSRAADSTSQLRLDKPSAMKRRKSRPERRDKAEFIGDRLSPVAIFIRERRTANDLSQRALAELAGVSQPYLSHLEGGKPSVRMDVVNRVLAIFGKELGVVDAPREKLEGEQ